jgi:hypothetical protein
MHDGINMGWAGANSNAAISNVAGAQEIVLTTSGGLGESETAGVILNVIPRDGGNLFNGSFATSGANSSMQGSNYTQGLKNQGLRAPNELINVWAVNPMGGGRIIRDRLWFYLTYNEVRAENTVPGMFFNKNAGDPTKWTVDFDTTRQAAHLRASISYVPGAHNLKSGYQGGFSNPSQKYHNLTEFIQYRFNNGVPNQLNQTAIYPGEVSLCPTA